MKRVFHRVLWNILCIFHIVGWGSTASFFTVWALDWSTSCVQGIERDLENGKARPSIQSWQNKTDKRGNSYSFWVLIIGNVIEKKEDREKGVGEIRGFSMIWICFSVFSHFFFFFLFLIGKKKRNLKLEEKLKCRRQMRKSVPLSKTFRKILLCCLWELELTEAINLWCYKLGVM